MTAEPLARRTGAAHASAVRRLDRAREEKSRLAILFKAALGTAAEPLARERLSAGRAQVAAREEWLHWIDEGESLAPWADGVWAPEAPPASQGSDERRRRDGRPITLRTRHREAEA